MISRLVVVRIPNFFVHLDRELCCQKAAALARFSDTVEQALAYDRNLRCHPPSLGSRGQIKSPSGYAEGFYSRKTSF
jgi:hypothetical protein